MKNVIKELLDYENAVTDKTERQKLLAEHSGKMLNKRSLHSPAEATIVALMYYSPPAVLLVYSNVNIKLSLI